jgi:RNA recognition motif-containing protein
VLAGEVVHAEVLMLPNGMSKGCGIVEYATRDEAQHSIATLSNTTFMGRQIFIREVLNLCFTI